MSGLGMFNPGWTEAQLRPIVLDVIDIFGPPRVMFGSNFPVDGLYSDYATLVGAFEDLLPDPAKPAVFGGTAAGFYRLG